MNDKSLVNIERLEKQVLQSYPKLKQNEDQKRRFGKRLREQLLEQEPVVQIQHMDKECLNLIDSVQQKILFLEEVLSPPRKRKAKQDSSRPEDAKKGNNKVNSLKKEFNVGDFFELNLSSDSSDDEVLSMFVKKKKEAAAFKETEIKKTKDKEQEEEEEKEKEVEEGNELNAEEESANEVDSQTTGTLADEYNVPLAIRKTPRERKSSYKSLSSSSSSLKNVSVVSKNLSSSKSQRKKETTTVSTSGVTYHDEDVTAEEDFDEPYSFHIKIPSLFKGHVHHLRLNNLEFGRKIIDHQKQKCLQMAQQNKQPDCLTNNARKKRPKKKIEKLSHQEAYQPQQDVDLSQFLEDVMNEAINDETLQATTVLENFNNNSIIENEESLGDLIPLSQSSHELPCSQNSSLPNANEEPNKKRRKNTKRSNVQQPNDPTKKRGRRPRKSSTQQAQPPTKSNLAKYVEYFGNDCEILPPGSTTPAASSTMSQPLVSSTTQNFEFIDQQQQHQQNPQMQAQPITYFIDGDWANGGPCQLIQTTGMAIDAGQLNQDVMNAPFQEFVNYIDNNNSDTVCGNNNIIARVLDNCTSLPISIPLPTIANLGFQSILQTRQLQQQQQQQITPDTLVQPIINIQIPSLPTNNTVPPPPPPAHLHDEGVLDLSVKSDNSNVTILSSEILNLNRNSNIIFETASSPIEEYDCLPLDLSAKSSSYNQNSTTEKLQTQSDFTIDNQDDEFIRHLIESDFDTTYDDGKSFKAALSMPLLEFDEDKLHKLVENERTSIGDGVAVDAQQVNLCNDSTKSKSAGDSNYSSMNESNTNLLTASFGDELSFADQTTTDIFNKLLNIDNTNNCALDNIANENTSTSFMALDESIFDHNKVQNSTMCESEDVSKQKTPSTINNNDVLIMEQNKLPTNDELLHANATTNIDNKPVNKFIPRILKRRNSVFKPNHTPSKIIVNDMKIQKTEKQSPDIISNDNTNGDDEVQNEKNSITNNETIIKDATDCTINKIEDNGDVTNNVKANQELSVAEITNKEIELTEKMAATNNNVILASADDAINDIKDNKDPSNQIPSSCNENPIDVNEKSKDEIETNKDISNEIKDPSQKNENNKEKGSETNQVQNKEDEQLKEINTIKLLNNDIQDSQLLEKVDDLDKVNNTEEDTEHISICNTKDSSSELSDISLNLKISESDNSNSSNKSKSLDSDESMNLQISESDELSNNSNNSISNITEKEKTITIIDQINNKESDIINENTISEVLSNSVIDSVLKDIKDGEANLLPGCEPIEDSRKDVKNNESNKDDTITTENLIATPENIYILKSDKVEDKQENEINLKSNNDKLNQIQSTNSDTVTNDNENLTIENTENNSGDIKNLQDPIKNFASIEIAKESLQINERTNSPEMVAANSPISLLINQDKILKCYNNTKKSKSTESKFFNTNEVIVFSVARTALSDESLSLDDNLFIDSDSNSRKSCDANLAITDHQDIIESPPKSISIEIDKRCNQMPTPYKDLQSDDSSLKDTELDLTSNSFQIHPESIDSHIDNGPKESVTISMLKSDSIDLEIDNGINRSVTKLISIEMDITTNQMPTPSIDLQSDETHNDSSLKDTELELSSNNIQIQTQSIHLQIDNVPKDIVTATAMANSDSINLQIDKGTMPNADSIDLQINNGAKESVTITMPKLTLLEATVGNTGYVAAEEDDQPLCLTKEIEKKYYVENCNNYPINLSISSENKYDTDREDNLIIDEENTLSPMLEENLNNSKDMEMSPEINDIANNISVSSVKKYDTVREDNLIIEEENAHSPMVEENHNIAKNMEISPDCNYITNNISDDNQISAQNMSADRTPSPKTNLSSLNATDLIHLTPLELDSKLDDALDFEDDLDDALSLATSCFDSSPNDDRFEESFVDEISENQTTTEIPIQTNTPYTENEILPTESTFTSEQETMTGKPKEPIAKDLKSFKIPKINKTPPTATTPVNVKLDNKINCSNVLSNLSGIPKNMTIKNPIVKLEKITRTVKNELAANGSVLVDIVQQHQQQQEQPPLSNTKQQIIINFNDKNNEAPATSSSTSSSSSSAVKQQIKLNFNNNNETSSFSSVNSRGLYSGLNGEALPLLNNIINLFGITCQPYLINKCYAITHCPLSHQLISPDIVFHGLCTLNKIDLNQAYRYVYNHSNLFHIYFMVFCKFFTTRNDRKKLLNMIDDCERYQPECSQFLITIYEALVNCGLNRANACRLVLKRSRERSTHNIDALVAIIMQSDWTMFTDFLEQCTEEIYTYHFRIGILEQMVPAVMNSKGSQLKQVFGKCVQTLHCDDAGLLVSSPSLLQCVALLAGT